MLGKAKYRTQGFKLCRIDHVIFLIFPVDNTNRYLGKQVTLFKIKKKKAEKKEALFGLASKI